MQKFSRLSEKYPCGTGHYCDFMFETLLLHHWFFNIFNFREPQLLDNQEKITKIDVQRPRLLKSSTNLKIEGDFFHGTEYADKFIRFLLERRAELLRTPTTLRLEGQMDTTTETGEKYIKYDIFERPALCKKFTQLHLEGDLDISTEKREKFIAFELEKRPPLVKKSTNLHMEGDMSLTPEYRHEYVAYGSLERAKLAIPVNHLRPGGVFENMKNGSITYDDKLHPTIPFLRDSDKKYHDHDLTRRTPSRLSREQSFSKTGDIYSASSRRTPVFPNITFTKASESDISRTSVNADLGYQTHDDAEYKNTTQEKPDVDELKMMVGSTGMETTPEYASVDFPRKRPYVTKPVCQVTNKGEVSVLQIHHTIDSI